ncbi:glycosyltransferase [Thalassospira xiamenensis]|uniref:glycosyltransferase n=1 Tax=Thalassospira xiamenensis TaxID=220697 RepID=UPI000E005E22|nr:glycosyltransferase [Thalassospira xiamenensis]RCK33587.1 hypothetical protein TH24_21305 [Thalassospira xiamenensis]
MTDKISHSGVVFILPSFAGGGAERVSITLLNQLSERSNFPELSLIVFDDAGPLSGLVSDKIKVHVLGCKRLREAFPILAKYILQNKPKIIFSNMAYVNQAVLFLKSFLPNDIKYIVREANTPLLGTNGLKRIILKYGYRFLYRKADEIVCPSRCVADDLLSYLDPLSYDPVVIYNPVDIAKINLNCEVAVRTPGLGIRLVAVGRLTYQKGFDRLVNLMPDLPSNTHLTILGEGPEKASLLKQIAELGLLGRVTLLGYVDNPWTYIAGADALVLPSRWEGLPNVALEALACGTKVISTPEAGGINEIVMLTSGSVFIADMGADFVAAIVSLKIKNQKNKKSENFLPNDFKFSQVVDRYEKLFLSYL